MGEGVPMFNASFLHPWLLVGLVGAALPVIIHLIGQRKAPTVRFAAFDFLVAVNKRLARREKLRQLLLLMLRTLAVVAMVMAMARPMPPTVVVSTEEARLLVLIVDASDSMAYLQDGKSLLEHAKEKAAELVSHLQDGDSVSLTVVGELIKTPFQAPTMDHRAVRDAISNIELVGGTADLGTSIEQVMARVEGRPESVVLALISDLSQNSFEQLRPVREEAIADMRLVDAATRERGQALPNVGIESLEITLTGDAPNERRFTMLVHNWGAGLVEDCRLELSIGGRVKQRGYVRIAGRSEVEKVLTVALDGTGVFEGELVLQDCEGGGYPVDDRMGFVLEVTRGVRVLAINGDPRTRPYEDELFFLEKALEAVPAGQPPIELTIATVDEVASGATRLDAMDVVVVANVGQLSEGLAQRLTTHLQAGRGLLFTLGDEVDFETTNRLLGKLLPHPLRGLHLAADPVAGTPPLGIHDLDLDHPILQGFDLALEESLGGSRTARYFNLEVGVGTRARSVLRFDNGAPALVEGRMDVGEGRTMLLTTSVDLGLTDLPLRSGFPALVQRMVRYLAGAQAAPQAPMTRLGRPVDVLVPTGARGLVLESPSGERFEKLLGPGSGRRLVFAELSEIGIYRAHSIGEGGGRVASLDVAVNGSLRESDFAPVDVVQVVTALGGGGEDSGIQLSALVHGQTDPFESRGYAPWLLVFLGCLFFSECLLASRG